MPSENTNLTPTQDPTSPYFIHPSDTSSQLVSVKFNGSSYGDWKRCIMIALSAKNKLGFVDGTVAKPVITSPLLKPWERCNDMIISWILFNPEPGIAKSVLYFNTAKEIWKDLEERFGYTSGPQLYALEHQLAELQQSSQNISEFYTSIKQVWDELNSVNPLPVCTCNQCTCNITQKVLKMQQEQRLMQFLMKLTEQYGNARSNILMMHPLPNISQAYRLLVQEQNHKEISSQQHSETMVFLADKKRYINYNQEKSCNQGRFFKPAHQSYHKPYNAGNNSGVVSQGNSRPYGGYNSGDSGSRTYAGKRPASTYFCTHCNIPGHSTERCFKLHGFPPNFKGFKERRANAAMNETEDAQDMDDSYYEQSNAADSKPITQGQYHHFLSLVEKLSKSEASTSVGDTGNTSSQALLAGPFNEREANSSW